MHKLELTVNCLLPEPVKLMTMRHCLWPSVFILSFNETSILTHIHSHKCTLSASRAQKFLCAFYIDFFRFKCGYCRHPRINKLSYFATSVTQACFGEYCNRRINLTKTEKKIDKPKDKKMFLFSLSILFLLLRCHRRRLFDIRFPRFIFLWD